VCQTNLVGDGDDFPSDNDGDEIPVTQCATYCSGLGMNPYSSCSSTSSTPSSTASCGPACQVDGFGTILEFPTEVVLQPVYATTIEEHVTIFVDGITSTTESTILAPPASLTPSPTLTWTFSGVVLTFPTTYVAYTDFSHISVNSVPTCSSGSVDLTLGQPTNWPRWYSPRHKSQRAAFYLLALLTISTACRLSRASLEARSCPTATRSKAEL